jgi:hypothetical protein
MRLVRYLKGTNHLGLKYVKPEGEIKLVGYADSDWAGNLEDGKSITGYCIFIGGNLISWKSKRQTTVATSSTVAELEALYQGVIEGEWIRGLLAEMGWLMKGPMLWYQDNQSAIKTIRSEKNLERTKHMVVKVFYLRQRLENKDINVEYLPTDQMRADIFTKALNRPLFEKFRDLLRVVEVGDVASEGEC